MGGTRRKQRTDDDMRIGLSVVAMDNLAQAIRKVLMHQSVLAGAGGVLYAHVGAWALQRLGLVQAKAVAGGALWRVGEGARDFVCHDYQANQPQPCVPWYATGGGALPSSMVHAWVQCGGFILDFTTFSLPMKAKALDSTYGEATHVRWAPDYLCVTRADCLPADKVRQSCDAGVFSYRREESVEQKLLAFSGEDGERQARGYVDTVLQVFQMLQQGSSVEVLGVDANSGRVLSEADVVADALHGGLKTVGVKV